MNLNALGLYIWKAIYIFFPLTAFFFFHFLLFSIFKGKMFFLDLDLRAHCHHGANAAKVWIFMPPHLATKYYLAPIVGFHNGAICYPKYFTPCYLKYPAAAIMTKIEISTKGLDRLGICRDRRDRRSCKSFVSCVNFSKK